MESKRFRQAIDARLMQLEVSKEMEMRLLSPKRSAQGKRVRLGRAVLAVCLCVLAAVPALAATSPGFRDLLRMLGTQTTQMLRPVELVSKSNGIRMEVIAAMNDDESLVAYISMHDTKGGKLNGDVDLYNYSITGMHTFGYDAVAYDDEQAAILRIMGGGGERMNGRKVTLRVDSFLSGRRVLDTFDAGVDLAKLQAAQSTLLSDMDSVNSYGGKWHEDPDNREDIHVLRQDQQNLPLPGVDFAAISGIGMVDGRLHVQVKWPQKRMKNEHIDDHGGFYLENANGECIYPDGVSFVQGGIAYSEDIFDISEPSGYRLYGYGFTTNDRYIQGEWQVTFQADAVKEPKRIDAHMDLGSARITSASLSPMGVALWGTGKAWPQDMKLAVTLKNGSLLPLDAMYDHSDEGALLRKYIPTGGLLDPEEVASIAINGITLAP